MSNLLESNLFAYPEKRPHRCKSVREVYIFSVNFYVPPCPVVHAITIHERPMAQAEWLRDEYAAAVTEFSSALYNPYTKVNIAVAQIVHPTATSG